MDTIQVKQNTKKSLILGQNQLFGFYFMTLVIIELLQKSFFFSQEQFDYEILSRVNQKELKARESDMVEDDQ